MLRNTCLSSAIILICCHPARSQCTYPATLTASLNRCLPTTLSVNSTHTLARIAWFYNGTPLPTIALPSPGTQHLEEAANGLRIPNDSMIPLGFFVDDNGNIYYTVVSGAYFKFSPAANAWSAYGDTTNPTSETGLVVDKAGNVFVSNLDGSVDKYAPGSSIPVVVAGGNHYGAAANQLSNPIGLALDCENNLYIADAGNNRVQRWAPGATSGVTVAGGNGAGNAANQLSNPVSVAVDGADNVFVSDNNNDRVQKWAPGATSGVTVAGGHGRGPAADQLQMPLNIFVDNSDNLYVDDLSPSSGLRRWGPSDTIGTTILDHSLAQSFNGIFSAFVDSKGTVYGGSTLDGHLLMLTWSQQIVNTYSPTLPGKYNAVVTDINGYTTSSDTLLIGTPPPGPPAISISAAATSLLLCQPDKFSADTANAGLDPSYQWQVSGVNVGTDTTVWSNNLFANGDNVYCIMTAIGVNCELVYDTSNIITLSVDPQSYATVSIVVSDSTVCAGTPITLTAAVANNTGSPGYDWFIDGRSSGITTATFTDTATGNQVVYCEITSNASCGLAKSNSIPISIYPQPSVPNQIFSIRHGQNLTLEPEIDGDAKSYLWTPGSGLSDSSIRNPVADPPVTTVYTLQVTSPGGCQAKGDITVYVYTPLSLPNAFTPNGDGRNDRLYVLGGPAGSTVHAFFVFDRWGSRIFSAQNTAPGDPSRGWDGTIAGRPAPPGTYVYMIEITFAGGSRQVYKGTVELIR